MLLSYKHVHMQAQQRLQEEGCVVDIIILDGNNTIRALQPFLPLGKDTARLNPKLSTSPIARTTNLVGQTKRIIRRDLQR